MMIVLSSELQSTFPVFIIIYTRLYKTVLDHINLDFALLVLNSVPIFDILGESLPKCGCTIIV